MSSTFPTSTPATRTTAPFFRPCTLVKRVLSRYCCQKKPPVPPTDTISSDASPTAMAATMPIFSSDQASERVLGMVSFQCGAANRSLLVEKRMKVRIFLGGGTQLRRVPLEGDFTAAQHDELRL